MAEVESGQAAIISLQAAGRIATQFAVIEARTRRTALWTPIRTAFVIGRVDGTPVERGETAAELEVQFAEADDLADRRADEAARAAALTEAERRIVHAQEKLGIAQRELAALDQQMLDREEAFLFDYPVVGQQATLASMLAFAERRQELIEFAVALQKQADELDLDEARLAPTIELLEQAEVRFGLNSSEGFTARVQALQSALGRHATAHNDYLRDCRDLETLGVQLRAEFAERDQLNAELASWMGVWPTAVAALGLPASTTPQWASKITTEWAGARGILTAIAQSRQRLVRMDEDEKSLAAGVAALAKRLSIEVPADPVAGERFKIAGAPMKRSA